MSFDFCHSAISYTPFTNSAWPTAAPPPLIPLLLTSITTALYAAILLYLRYHSLRARTATSTSSGHVHTKHLIFPLYTTVLYVSCIITLTMLLFSIFLHPHDDTPHLAHVMLYRVPVCLIHVVYLSMALMLLHMGVGKRSAYRSVVMATAWALIKYVLEVLKQWCDTCQYSTLLFSFLVAHSCTTC